MVWRIIWTHIPWMCITGKNWLYNVQSRGTLWRRDATPLRMNASGMLKSSMIYEKAFALSINMQPCKYGMCECMLLSRAGYANHLKVHHNNQEQANYGNLIHCHVNNRCVVCNKVFRSSAGLRRHIMVHRRVVGYVDGIFICNICLVPMWLNAGLKTILGAMYAETGGKTLQVMWKARRWSKIFFF